MVAIPPLSPAIANPATPFSAAVDAETPTAAPAQPSSPKASHDKAIHDGMEEVSAAFSEQMERKSKSLNRRQISQTQNRMEANIERIEKLTELFHLLENPRQPTLDQQVRSMRQLMLQTSSASVDALVQAAGGDAARADIVLRHVLAQAQQQGDASLQHAAQSSLERLQQEKGPEVRAGLNTAAALSLFSTDPQQKQILRELYYARIVHQQSPSSLLDALLERFDAQHFAAGLRTLQRALAADIASLASSISKTALSQMLKHLNDARQLSHTLSSSQQLLEHDAHRFPAATLGAVELTRRLIGLSANGAYVRDLHNLGREVAGQHAERQLLFFNALLRLVGGLPQTLWRDSKHRHTAMHLIRGLIGDLSRHETDGRAATPGKE
ncbi:type III secretion system gatekeeper subunit SctW [Lonsdalea quercina]|uniref:type III secretion system gatekeeper subunit SctW n=1 Tax=Lonsdalea quercina TaxID=71657 RepID=UPI003975E967